MSPIKIAQLSSSSINRNLFEELKLLPLPDDKKVELLDKAAQLVESRFALKISEHLSEDHKQKFMEIDIEESIQLLNAQVPDWPQFLEAEILRVRNELIELVKNDPELNQ